jgi:hypothetical protein
MERRKQDKGFIASVMDVNSILESDEPKETGRIALGFEVEGTLSVRGPDVPDGGEQVPSWGAGKPKALAGAPRKIGLVQLEAQGIFLPESMRRTVKKPEKVFFLYSP